VRSAASASPGGPPPRRRPPGRYDEPSRTAARALAVVLSLLFLGLLAAIALALYTRYGGTQVPLQPRGFAVLSDDAVRVDFTVTPPAGRTAWCLVRARGATGVEVGVAAVAVRRPAGSSGPVEASYELTTTARAVTGEVPRCSPDPPPPGVPTGRVDP
jgi:hypothetical protein